MMTGVRRSMRGERFFDELIQVTEVVDGGFFVEDEEALGADGTMYRFGEDHLVGVRTGTHERTIGASQMTRGVGTPAMGVVLK